MSERVDNTTGYVTPSWLPEPTPGTPAYHLIESDLRAQSEAEVHAPMSDTGERVLEYAKGRIERSTR